jgi:hypothetical protein
MGKMYRTLEYLERLRPAPGDRQKALADARTIADHLKREYGAEVYGVGSLFVPGRNFTEHSDIDLVVKGLPAGRFFSILAKLDDMTLDLADIRPAVFSKELFERILPFLRFRHLFRNMYSYELKAEKIRELGSGFARLVEDAAGALALFCDWLGRTASEG